LVQQRAAIFDVDLTLLDGWCGHLYAGHVMRARPWRRRAWSALGRRGWGLLRAGLQQTAAVDTGVRILAGLREDDAHQLAQACFEQRIRRRLYADGVAEVLRWRRDDGCLTVLASGSSRYIVEAVGTYLGVDAALGSENQLDTDGRLSDRAQGRLCYGEGKLERVQRLLDAHGIALTDAVFYSDSETDLPLLEAVGRAVVVNPTPLLRLHARARGWQEEAWGEVHAG
jgi:HAD superfamily hydrolase (TIGR01490 family)